MTPTKTPKAALVAAVLAIALAIPASTLAATSQQATESLTVNSTLSLTGVPATLSYGAANAGANVFASFTINASTNAANGLTLSGSGTALTNGSATIPATARSFDVDGFASDTGPTFSHDYPSGVATNVGITSWIAIPANAKGGSYTGTLTISVADRP